MTSADPCGPTRSMLRLNKTGRYDLAQYAIEGIMAAGLTHSVDTDAHLLISGYQHKNREHEKYVLIHGEDPEELSSATLYEA